jgi:hypothetical protein
MSARKTDFFGSFLDAMKTTSVAPRQGPAQQAPATADAPAPPPLPAADPLNEVLKALLPGEQSLRDLLGHAGNSLTLLLHVVGQLHELGLVQRLDGDRLALTEKGRDFASVVK